MGNFGTMGDANKCRDLVCVAEKHFEHPPAPRVVPMTPSQNNRYERSMLYASSVAIIT